MKQRFAVTLALSLTVLPLVGCDTAAPPSGRAEGEHACGPVEAGEFVPEPSVVGVAGDGKDALPRRWVDAPSEDEVVEAAQSGPSRAQGERFAFLALQRFIDTRTRADGQRLVDELGAEELPREACLHLASRTDAQFALGWGAYVSPAFPVFHRSRAVGPDTGPDRVELEVISTMELVDDPEFFGDTSEAELPMRVRIDVVRQGGLWLLADWAGPETTGRLTEGQPNPRFHGTGWRSWRPAGS